MKTRDGFVSNSSTSSFVCAVCGGVESGYDQSPEELGMSECINGHTFHDDCSKAKKLGLVEQIQLCKEAVKVAKYIEASERKAWVAELEALEASPDEDAFEEFLDKNDIQGTLDGDPRVACPICTMTALGDDQIIAYLIRKHYNATTVQGRKQITAECANQFKTYADFCKYLTTKTE